jgi:GNAT superfamily N-acetyltransferase
VSFVLIRCATFDDADILAAILADYLREGYVGHAGSTSEQLRRDVLNDKSRHYVLLAEIREHLVGFIAWDTVYDMHWAMSGGQINDLYVAPMHRGLGVALALVARTAAEVRADDGAFLRGGAYDRESTRRAYGRVAVVQPSGETHLSGRAFRQIAELACRPTREILLGLPPIEWNFEA